MEKVYVWGLGFFYKCNANKIDSIFEVCGFIDNGKKGDESDQYGRILGSNEITADMTILVMTKSFIPLLAELAKKNIKRVIVGMTIFPESYQEKLLAENGQILIKSGKVIYQFNDGNIVALNSERDLSNIFNRLLADKKIFENINTLPVIPTCRDFGISRGTPIDRYYIENFLNENKLDIKGSVLEYMDKQNDKYFFKNGENPYKQYALEIIRDLKVPIIKKLIFMEKTDG